MNISPSGMTYSTRPLKRFGQHFLASPAVARSIVDAAGATSEDAVLEIGPGRGILTDLLTERAGRLVAVELDRHLARELAARYHHLPHVRIIQSDFLDLDPMDLGLSGYARNLAVSNLPYNAAVPIMEKLFQSRIPFAKMVVMVQREMAARMAAGPGAKNYGSLSVFIQAKAEVERLFDVKPGSFVPPPKVMSTVVELRPFEKVLVPESEAEGFHEFVRACFGYRRKMLQAGLRQVLKNPAVAPGAKNIAGIDLTRRAESLSVGEFLGLYRAVSQSKTEGNKGC